MEYQLNLLLCQRAGSLHESLDCYDWLLFVKGIILIPFAIVVSLTAILFHLFKVVICRHYPSSGNAWEVEWGVLLCLLWVQVRQVLSNHTASPVPLCAHYFNKYLSWRQKIKLFKSSGWKITIDLFQWFATKHKHYYIEELFLMLDAVNYTEERKVVFYLRVVIQLPYLIKMRIRTAWHLHFETDFISEWNWGYETKTFCNLSGNWIWAF